MRAKLRQIGARPAAHGLRVLSYNVLAQSLISRDFYPTNGNAVKWAQRFPALSDELRTYDPDVLFLQEVDAVKLKNWVPLLEGEPLNMELHFFCAPNKNHGVAIAFKRAKLRHVAHEHPHYDSERGPPQQVATRGTGAAMVVELIENGQRLVIGTTHLYWHPHADYERLRQVIILLDAVTTLAKEYSATGLILGGDFNSTPDSPAYLVLKTRHLGEGAVEALERSAETSTFGLLNAKPGEGHPTLIKDPKLAVQKLRESLSYLEQTHLISCYDTLGGEPKFTNWTDGFRETIDYIFVSENLKPTFVLPLPEIADLGPEPNSLPRAWGDHGYPSDHFPILADVILP